MKLKKEFEDFYKEIRIGSESDVLIEKRETLEGEIKDKFPDKLEDHGIELNKSDIRMFDQGSYKYNTTISSDVVDRDVAVMIPLSISDNPDPRKIKGYLRDAININSRTVEIKDPCVRAVYHENGEEWLHIDLPLYAKDGNNVYLARGKFTSEKHLWEEADPDGLNDDLCGKINGNNQLRRVICYIKKWKVEKYSNSTRDHEVPPSIGLTYLACDCFSSQSSGGHDDDLSALQKTMKNTGKKFDVGAILENAKNMYPDYQAIAKTTKKSLGKTFAGVAVAVAGAKLLAEVILNRQEKKAQQVAQQIEQQ